MSVICFAPSETPPWNNQQSQRLLNVSNIGKEITDHRGYYKDQMTCKNTLPHYRDRCPILCILPTG